MKTKQILSNISYNTIDFLKSKLDNLISKNVIDFYMFVFHKAEDDELKDHIHFIIYPSCIFNTDNYKSYFAEFVDDEILPRNITMVWKPVSKNNDLDWLLYCLHDVVYCKANCLVDKRYIYTKDDIVYSDRLTFEDIYFRAFHETEFYHDKAITEIVTNNNYTSSDLIKNGYVPIRSSCQYHHFMQMMKEN